MKHENSFDSTPTGGKLLRCFTMAVLLIAASAAGLSPSAQLLYSSPQTHGAAVGNGPNLGAEQDATRQALSIAEAQHEKVRLLISQGRYDRVLAEVKLIFDLKLPDKYESNVAQSACIIANDLSEKNQFALALEVLETALLRMKLAENKVAVLKIEASVYKTQGNLDRALKCLEKAIEIEKQH